MSVQWLFFGDVGSVSNELRETHPSGVRRTRGNTWTLKRTPAPATVTIGIKRVSIPTGRNIGVFFENRAATVVDFGNPAFAGRTDMPFKKRRRSRERWTILADRWGLDTSERFASQPQVTHWEAEIATSESPESGHSPVDAVEQDAQRSRGPFVIAFEPVRDLTAREIVLKDRKDGRVVGTVSIQSRRSDAAGLFKAAGRAGWVCLRAKVDSSASTRQLESLSGQLRAWSLGIPLLRGGTPEPHVIR